MSDTRERLDTMVRDVFGKPPEGTKLDDRMTFDGDLDADSLDRIEFAMEVEDAFKIEITDAELAQVATFGDAVVLVESKRSN